MEDLFWFMASMVSVHCHLASLFLGLSEAEHYNMRMWKSGLPYSGQETQRETKGARRDYMQDKHFQRIPPKRTPSKKKKKTIKL